MLPLVSPLSPLCCPFFCLQMRVRAHNDAGFSDWSDGTRQRMKLEDSDDDNDSTNGAVNFDEFEGNMMYD
jgi:hypothetical protein